MENKLTLHDLRSTLRENNSSFHFRNFFKRSDTTPEGAAISVITSRQIITTLTQNDGLDCHDDMLFEIIRAISGLSKQDKHYYEFLNNVIVIKLWFFNGDKYISIEFPEHITKEQLAMLKAYQKRYGAEINRIKNETNGEFINCDLLDSYRLHNCQSRISYTFDDIVTFATKITSAKKSPEKSEYIIGFTQEYTSYPTERYLDALHNIGNTPFDLLSQQLSELEEK